MSETRSKIKGSIKDVLERIHERIVPTVIETARLDELIDAFERSRHSRILYAVNAENKFLGIIDVKDISRHLLFHYNEMKLGTRELIRLVTSEYAKDFIKKERCSALIEETYESVLERMLKYGADEIPVLSENGDILGDITIIDMIEYYVYKTGRDKLGIHL